MTPSWGRAEKIPHLDKESSGWPKLCPILISLRKSTRRAGGAPPNGKVSVAPAASPSSPIDGWDRLRQTRRADRGQASRVRKVRRTCTKLQAAR